MKALGTVPSDTTVLQPILFLSLPDPTYPEGKVRSAESSTVLALIWSLFGNTHCQLGSPHVSVHRPFALYWQM